MSNSVAKETLSFQDFKTEIINDYITDLDISKGPFIATGDSGNQWRSLATTGLLCHVVACALPGRSVSLCFLLVHAPSSTTPPALKKENHDL